MFLSFSRRSLSEETDLRGRFLLLSGQPLTPARGCLGRFHAPETAFQEYEVNFRAKPAAGRLQRDSDGMSYKPQRTTLPLTMAAACNACRWAPLARPIQWRLNEGNPTSSLEMPAAGRLQRDFPFRW